MSSLAEFQEQLFAAVLHAESMPLHDTTGLRVYQNTVMHGLVDVLRAAYPSVERLTGLEWFVETARGYVHAHPPATAPLSLYGADFPAHVHQCAVAGMPFLKGVAELDRLWSEAHFAADTRVLDAQQLQALLPQQLASLHLTLHPAARLARLSHGAVTLWLAHRPPAEPPAQMCMDDVEEAVLFTRPHGQVQVEHLLPHEHEFVAALASGQTLAQATQLLWLQRREAEVAGLFARLLLAGCFAQHAPALMPDVIAHDPTSHGATKIESITNHSVEIRT